MKHRFFLDDSLIAPSRYSCILGFLTSFLSKLGPFGLLEPGLWTLLADCTGTGRGFFWISLGIWEKDLKLDLLRDAGEAFDGGAFLDKAWSFAKEPNIWIKIKGYILKFLRTQITASVKTKFLALFRLKRVLATEVKLNLQHIKGERFLF